MKKLIKRLLSVLLALIMVLTLVPGLRGGAHAVDAGPANLEELWSIISQFEERQTSVAQDDPEAMDVLQGYESLLPQIEELVKSYANYEEGSLHYKDGVLLWRSDGMTCGYDPEFRKRIYQNEADAKYASAGASSSGSIALRNIGTDVVIKNTGFSNGSTPDGVVNVSVFMPYDGTEKNNFAGHEDFGKVIASYTGGTSKAYKAADADIDKLADAIEDCAVVVIGSHGASGSFGLTTDKGLTENDYKDDHAVFYGIYYKSGSSTEDYRLWMIDGTVIANHMDKNAQNNLVISSSCMGMKNDALCAPLRNKGVGVVYGYSESVTSSAADQFEHALIDALGRGMTVAEAILEMKKVVGCAWDAFFRNMSLEDAMRSGVAFPIVVSDEDAYPGEGNVNFVQTVKSTWKLPLKADLSGKHVISLNKSASLILAETGDPVSAASVVSGSLPAGMTLSTAGNQVLLTGTPTHAGKTTFTLRFAVSGEGSREKKVEILVADYANVHTYSQDKSWTSLEMDMWATWGMIKDTAEEHEIECSPTLASIDAVQILENNLSCSLAVVLDEGKVYIRTVKNTTYARSLDYYIVTPPGVYSVTFDCITESGEVFRQTVNITVNAANTYSYKDSDTYATDHLTLDLTATQFNECNYNLRTGAKYSNGNWVRWNPSSVSSFAITSGSLPEGLYMDNSWLHPFGFYGTPAKAGTTTVHVRMTNNFDIYEYEITFTVKKPHTISLNANGGTVSPSVLYANSAGRLNSIPRPERLGYSFTGWYTAQTGGAPIGLSTVFTEDTTIYAHWVKTSSFVTFDPNGGIVSPAIAATNTENKLESLPTPTREGYTFLGWFTEPTGGYSISTSTVFTEDTTIYAHWKVSTYTVTWVIDGKEEKETYEYGANPGHAIPQKEGDVQYHYIFMGWEPELKPVTGDVTYTAKFNEVLNTYTVTWDIDGKKYMEYYEYGANPGHAIPTKAETEQYTYTFKSWVPDLKPVTGDATYTAEFFEYEKPVITWVIDGVEEKEYYSYGANPGHAIPTKAETEQYTYTFKSWVPDLKPVTGDATYTAEFFENVKTYTITYDAGEGVKGEDWVDTFNVDYGYKLEAGKLVAPPEKFVAAAEGMEFAGMERDGVKYSVGDDVPELIITKDITIRYLWNNLPFEYTVVSESSTDGTAGKWIKESGADYEIIVKRSILDEKCFSNFTSLNIEDKTLVLDTEYTAKAGSTVLTIKSETLEKFDAGKYDVTITFKDAEVKTTLTVEETTAHTDPETPTTPDTPVTPETPVDPDSPATGDSSNIDLWIAMLSAAVLSLAVVLFTDKKRRTR